MKWYILSPLIFIPYIVIAFKLAPLNEEEWIIGQKDFIVGFDKKSNELVIASSFCSEKKSFESRIIISDKVYLSFSKLPPVAQLCFFGKTVPILGWTHTGPISFIYYKLFEPILGTKNIFLLRLPALIFILLSAFVFAKKLKEPLFSLYFLSFPVSLFFVSVANLYYSMLYFFSFLSFLSLLEKRFFAFYLWSSLAILTHMRGFFIFLSLFIAFVINSIISNERKELRLFIKSALRYGFLIVLSIFVYLLPAFATFQYNPDIYYVQAFSPTSLIKHFIFRIIGKIPVFIQLIGTRIGDLFFSSNIAFILKELGLLKSSDILFVPISFASSILFFVPAFFNLSFNIIFIGIYFVLSLFAVPFFFGMPWQFIPVSFAYLTQSYMFFKRFGIAKMLPVLLGILTALVGVFRFEKLMSNYAIWENHREVIHNLEPYKEKKILAITKSNIFHLYFPDLKEAKYFVLLSENRGDGNIRYYILEALRNYDLVVLSYHFWDLEDVVLSARYKKIFSNSVFSVFLKE